MDYLKKTADILNGTGFEGNVPYMYRDTSGFVKVGVGEKIPDMNAAKKLPFLTPLGELANATEIERDFKRVEDMPPGKAHEDYKKETSLVLGDDYIQELLIDKLKDCDNVLRRHYLGYDTFPEPVKMALVDMVYNLGKAQLFGQFPQLEKAVNAQDWKAAAEASHRKHGGATDNRNAWARFQFLVSEVKKPVPPLPVHPAHRDAPLMLPQKG